MYTLECRNNCTFVFFFNDACSYPAKVFKGMRMGGQMGGKRVTTQNLKVLKVIPEHNLLLVKGSVPGCNGSIVIVEK